MFIPAPVLLPSATHHTERRVASARWRSPSSVPPTPRAGGRTPVTTPFGTVGEGLQRPQRFQCLPTKPDEGDQHRWPPVSGASTPISRASGRSASPRYPSCPLIDRHAFQPAILKRNAPHTSYPVHLVVSRETCSALRWYSVGTVKPPLFRPHRYPHAPMWRRDMGHSQSK